MRVNWKKLLICIAIPLAVGGLASALSGGMGEAYQSYIRPPLSPPSWLFPVVWTILYALMGYASYLVGEAPGENQKALRLYAVQLALNFLWPIIFFRFEWVGIALLVLIALWITVLLTIRAFSQVSERAGDLLIPYILWLTFALYLNFGIFLVN